MKSRAFMFVQNLVNLCLIFNVILCFYLLLKSTDICKIVPDDFLCKDRRKCIDGNLVCDGRAHCLDGSDEVACYMAPKSSSSGPLKCRQGSKPCKDGSECVLYSHVCDGERDCKDGSDERGCEYKCKAGKTHEADS